MRRRRPIGKVTLALVLLSTACSSCRKIAKTTGDASTEVGDLTDTAAGWAACIADWPKSGAPHWPKPSLAVAAPKLLWQDSLDGIQRTDDLAGPVLAAGRLALQSGDWIYFVSTDGASVQQVKYNPMAAFPSGLVADPEGNVYYTAPDGVYSLGPTGQIRWSTPCCGPAKEFAQGIPPVLGPDGVVYAVTFDEKVGAYRASDGSPLWSRPAPFDTCCSSAVMGGGGSAVFVAVGGTETIALTTSTGTELGAFVRPAYGRSFTWQWGSWVLGWDIGIAHSATYVFDTCGNLTWPTGGPGASGVVTVGELLVTGDTTSLRLFDAAGNLVAGPSPGEGRPIAAGGDGTIYTFRCESSSPAVNRLLAYSADLQELWRLDLGGSSCLMITGNVVLDDDGVMYMMRATPDAPVGTQVLAIQTASPGLAESSWPSWRHDNCGTAWLVPGTATSVDRDGGGVADPVDAPGPESD
jgi:outer membrane protein assembly factor BamB